MNLFISYAHDDINFVEQLTSDLRAHDLDLWIDHINIRVGEDWEKAIVDGVTRSHLVVVCMTPEAVESEWVKKEVFLASSLGKRMIPLMVKLCFEQISNSQELRRLLDLQMIIFDQHYEAGLARLIEAVLEQERSSALDRLYRESDSIEFRSAVEQAALNAESIVMVGIGLNIMGQEPFAVQLMQNAAQGNCHLEIYLANPYAPAVQTRLIEEDAGEVVPPDCA